MNLEEDNVGVVLLGDATEYQRGRYRKDNRHASWKFR